MRWVPLTVFLAVCVVLPFQAHGQPDLPVPVLLVDMGRTPSAPEVEAALETIASPTVRGDGIITRLGLRLEGKEADARSLLDEFERGKDLFFDGDHTGSRPSFERVFKDCVEAPHLMSILPALRNAAFDSAVFLTIMERDSSDNSDATDWLSLAAERFPDLEPEPADFPPWVRKDFAGRKAAIERNTGRLEFVAPPGCKLVVEGRELKSEGAVAGGLGTGARAVRVLCHGRLSPISTVVLGSDIATYRPVLIADSTLVATADDLMVKAAPGADASSVVDDLINMLEAGGWQRGVALVGAEDSFSAWLIDTGAAGIVRSGRTGKAGASGAARTTSFIVPGPIDGSGPGMADSETTKWFRDGPAWVLVGTGLAALGAGIALGQVYGGPSSQEPAAWALMLAGGSLAATGVVLFVIPDKPVKGADTQKKNLVVGLAGTWHF